MASIQMERLLETCIKRGASDLHLSVGRPPTLRLHGRLRPLETKVLEPEDTISLMKAITPDRCQQELQEQGGTDFGFGLIGTGTKTGSEEFESVGGGFHGSVIL